ncbi:recombination directionality factor [Spirosoma aerolatum]|uniref:recombination directionality factor n=1 Tax=Spirosoma aerolatum TaxID=1211326 RepID=UPI0009ABEA6D|nr:hypothetical protein [Spirosoma aerolatum]
MRIQNNPLQKAVPNVPPAAKRTLPEVGRISIGEKGYTADNRAFPKSTDYFVVRSRFDQKVTAQYGDKPTELPVFFYSDDFNEVCTERLEIRDKAGALYAYGDGETFYVYSKGAYLPVTIDKRPDLIESCENYLKQQAGSQAKYIKWAHVLTMRFCIKNVPVLGYWQFSTKGVDTSIPNLRDRFDGSMQAFGSVRFLPFSLTIKKVKSNKPGVTDSYPVVDLVPMFSMETGLQVSKYLAEHPTENPAKLALMDLSKPLELGSNGLLLGSGEGGEA